MPRHRAAKVLIVEPNPDVVEILVGTMTHRLKAQLTCVSDAASCMEIELVEPHDLVLAEVDLPDGIGLRLAKQLVALSERPVFLMGADPHVEDVIDAMRAGVSQYFAKPFPVSEMLDAAERALQAERRRRMKTYRYYRMRDLVRRVIRERRLLNERTELVCRDLVGSHRRLVHRVLAMQQHQSAEASG